MRLLAAYGRPWKTKGVADPHALPPADMDFDLTFRRNGRACRWSRIWNFAPDRLARLHIYVQAPARAPWVRTRSARWAARTSSGVSTTGTSEFSG